MLLSIAFSIFTISSRSLLRIVLVSTPSLFSWDLYVSQNNKQIYSFLSLDFLYSLFLFSFLLLLSLFFFYLFLSRFSFFFSMLRFSRDLWGYTIGKKVCLSWWWNSTLNGNSWGERVVLGEAPIVVESNVEARNPIGPLLDHVSKRQS